MSQGRTGRSFGLAILLLLLLPVCAYAQSPKSPQINDPKEQQKTVIAESPPVQLTPAAKAAPHQKDESRGEQEDRKEKYFNDIWLVRLTAAILFTGFLQFLVFLFQAGAFLKQAGFMRDAANEIKKGSMATQDAVRLAREEFVSAHQPELRVRHVKMAQKGNAITVSFSVVNSGTTKAITQSSSVTAGYFEDGNLPVPNELAANNVVTRKIFHPGNADSYSVECAAPEGTGAKNLNLIGWIAYKDGLGNMRKTYFCRRKSPQGFTPATDLDYEAID